MLELPYEEYEASFIVILPIKVDGIATLIDKLKDPDALELAIWHMNTFNIDVSLPKFTIETKTDLKNVLERVSIDNNNIVNQFSKPTTLPAIVRNAVSYKVLLKCSDLLTF